MKLSCADYTWPLLPHTHALNLIAALGFDAVDLGFMGNRSHIRPETLPATRADVQAAAASMAAGCRQRGLQIADLFAIPWSDHETMALNNPDGAQQHHSTDFFQLAIWYAAALGVPGMTTLPGVVFDDEPWSTALQRSAEQLRWRVDAAATAGLALSVEAHVESLIDTPEKAADLLDRVDGLTLTLDYGHFICQGHTQADIDPLLPQARHHQLRAAAPGVLQARIQDNTINFHRIVAKLRAAGYDGYLATEYVWSTWRDCDRVDNLSETIQLRDLLRDTIR